MKFRMAMQNVETAATHGAITLRVLAVIAEMGQNYFRLSFCMFVPVAGHEVYFCGG